MLIGLIYILILIIQTYAGIVKGPDSTLIISRVLSLSTKVDTIGPHQWHHNYDIGNVTDLMPVVNGTKSTYKFDIEKFDNGSNLYCKRVDGGFTVNIRNDLFSNCGVQPMKLLLVDDGYYEDRVDKIYEYHENEQIVFDCVQHPLAPSASISDVFIGWIYPESGKISLHGKNRGAMKGIVTLNKEYNFSVICCVYYITTESSSHTQILRYVTNKTRLIWKDNSESQVETISTSTAVNTEIEVGSTERDQIFKENVTKYSPDTPERNKLLRGKSTLNGNKNNVFLKQNISDTPNDTLETKVNNSLIIGVGSAVFVLTIIVLAVLVMVKKHSSTYASGSPRLDQKNVDVGSPFYLNLLFREECNRQINNNEQEHHYEEIS